MDQRDGINFSLFHCWDLFHRNLGRVQHRDLEPLPPPAPGLSFKNKKLHRSLVARYILSQYTHNCSPRLHSSLDRFIPSVSNSPASEVEVEALSAFVLIWSWFYFIFAFQFIHCSGYVPWFAQHPVPYHSGLLSCAIEAGKLKTTFPRFLCSGGSGYDLRSTNQMYFSEI